MHPSPSGGGVRAVSSEPTEEGTVDASDPRQEDCLVLTIRKATNTSNRKRGLESLVRDAAPYPHERDFRTRALFMIEALEAPPPPPPPPPTP